MCVAKFDFILQQLKVATKLYSIVDTVIGTTLSLLFLQLPILLLLTSFLRCKCSIISFVISIDTCIRARLVDFSVE